MSSSKKYRKGFVFRKTGESVCCYSSGDKLEVRLEKGEKLDRERFGSYSCRKLNNSGEGYNYQIVRPHNIQIMENNIKRL